jgi:hypothetical protein
MLNKSSFDFDTVLTVLAHASCGGPDFSEVWGGVDRGARKWHARATRDFDGFEIIDGVAEDFDEDDATTYILKAADPTDQPVWPLDVRMVTRAREEDGWPAGTWSFMRMKTLVPSEWRGRLRKFTPRMMEIHHIFSKPDGVQLPVVQPYLLFPTGAVAAPCLLTGMRLDVPGDWVMAPNPGWFGDEQKDVEFMANVTERCRMAAGLALRRRYLWSVLLGEGTGPRVRFITDPIGVREVFRLRDLPPGKQRRDALLHWVRQHWRKRRKAGADDLAAVREYLRGAVSYNWNGLRCQIEPSTYDAERARRPELVAAL